MLDKWGQDMLETSWGHKVDPNHLNLSSVIFIFVAGSFALFFRNTPSDFFHLFCILTPVIPMLVIVSEKEVGEMFCIAASLAFLVSYFVSKLPFNAPIIRLKNGFMTERLIVSVSVFLGFLIILLTISRGGLNYLNFSFSEVYEFRRAASASRGTLLNYLLLNYIALVLPLSIALTIKQKRFHLLIIFAIINILIFGLTSNKSYIFAGPFAIGVYFILSRPKPAFLIAFSAAIIITSLTIIYHFNKDFYDLPTLFIRRYFFVPAYVNLQYWEFFSYNPYAFWSDSKVSLGMVEPVYAYPTPRIVGAYFTQADFSRTASLFTNSNTAWIGSGFGNAGYFGMFFYAILSGIVCKYGNTLSKIIGFKAAVSGMGFYFFSVFFTSTDLPAALLSYGMFLTIFIMILWNQNHVKANKL
jgi:hypothetical protein